MAKIWIVALLTATFGLPVNAEAPAKQSPKVIQVYKLLANGKTKIYTTGLVMMDQIFDEPGANCTQMTGIVKIEGVQFSPSGNVLESFRFTDKKGNQFSVPTNIAELPNAERGIANNFIRNGNNYFAHIQICGSGGFTSLINLYDSRISLGAFE